MQAVMYSAPSSLRRLRKSDDTNEPGQRRSGVDCRTARPEVGR